MPIESRIIRPSSSGLACTWGPVPAAVDLVPAQCYPSGHGCQSDAVLMVHGHAYTAWRVGRCDWASTHIADPGAACHRSTQIGYDLVGVSRRENHDRKQAHAVCTAMHEPNAAVICRAGLGSCIGRDLRGCCTRSTAAPGRALLSSTTRAFQARAVSSFFTTGCSCRPRR